MTEDTKREKFRRILAIRLPKAIKAVELLTNLSRKSDYEWSTTELQDMVNQLDDAVDGVLASFGVPSAAEPQDVHPTVDDTDVDDGDNLELDEQHEVRWAYDCIRRGDVEVAEARLRRLIVSWDDGGHRVI